MGMRYRKSIRLGKGARINLSKSGIGASVGVKGARYSVHSSGRRTSSVGAPGTGLYFVNSKSGTSGRKVQASSGMTEAQQRRLIERYEKKEQLIEERRQKPLRSLNEQYAAGKISKEKFENLSKRDAEITKDLVIFGRGAGVKLAERYLLGKIDTDEFETMKNELIGDPEAEKDQMVESYKQVIKYLCDFIEVARSNKSESACNYCSKPKGFFSPLSKTSDFKLCFSCKRKYKKLQVFNGIGGRYYKAEGVVVDPDVKNTLVMNILPEHILEYR